METNFSPEFLRALKDKYLQSHKRARSAFYQQTANMLLTPAQMREMERRYMEESGVASIDLMERAARALTDALLQRFGADRTIFFACGPGGNGGDGLAAARLYQAAGGRAAFALCGEVKSPDAVENLRRAREAGVREIDMDGGERPDVWVDALFGTGLSRALSGEALDFVGRINGDRARGSRVVAVDIPSGVSGLSGGGPDGETDEDEDFVRADVTITFQRPKVGHYLDFGLVATGELAVADIGIPAEYLPKKEIVYLYEVPASFRGYTFPRNTHKGDRGHVLIVAGSMGMAGAAALCAGAALRCGAGLVTVACPASIVPILQVLEPCAMCAPLPEKDGALSAEAAAPLRELARGKDSIAIGPGLSRRCAPEVLEAVLESKQYGKLRPPTVIDADALNLLAAHPELQARLDRQCLLTPHPGEARRLLGREMTDLVSDARALAALGAGVVLKSASRAICASPESPVAISATGCSGMAKGGSGDVLTGMLAGMARTAHEPARVCELHGMAGVLAEEKYGNACMTSRNILEMLPEAFRRLAARREEQP